MWCMALWWMEWEDKELKIMDSFALNPNGTKRVKSGGEFWDEGGVCMESVV